MLIIKNARFYWSYRSATNKHINLVIIITSWKRGVNRPRDRQIW